MTLVIIVAIALALFSLAFITKRRFGVLGLSLAAGTVLSQSWGSEVARFLEATDSPVEPLSVRTAATVLLILAPPLILLATGPKYNDRKFAILGSLCFALLGSLLLLGPLTTDLPIADPSVKPVLDFIAEWQNLLIASGIALAIVDMFYANSPKLAGKKSGKH